MEYRTRSHRCQHLLNQTHPAMDDDSASNFTDLGGVVLRSLQSQSPPPPAMRVAKAIVGVTGIVGNLLVVIVLVKYQNMFKHVKTTLIINQSLLDGVVSVVLIVSTFLDVKLYKGVEGLSSELYCKLWTSQILLWGLMMSSTHNLMAISIERYLAVVYPMWHRATFSSTKANVVAVFIWMIGVPFVASFVVPTTILVRGKCLVSYLWPSRAAARAVGCIQIFFNLIMPILVHSFCYARMLQTLRRRMAIVHPEDHATSTAPRGATRETSMTAAAKRSTGCVLGGRLNASLNTTQSVRSLPSTSMSAFTTDFIATTRLASGFPDRRQNFKVAQFENAKRNIIKTLAIITACYFICWTPNKIYIVMYMLGEISTFNDTFHATVILVFINCCINPIIFIVKCHPVRRGIQMLFR